MFPQRRVNALTPIFASLHREDEDLSLPAKIPIKHVHNSLQLLRSCSTKLAKSISLSDLMQTLLMKYQKRDVKNQQQRSKARTEESFFEFTEESERSVAPFALNQEDHFAADLEANLFDWLPAHLLFAQHIQQIADSYQVVLGLQQPIQAGQKLLTKGFRLAQFEHSLNFSEAGPTAGMLTYDACYCTPSKSAQQKHQNDIVRLLSDKASLVELHLPPPLIKNAIAFGNLKKLSKHHYAAIYFGKQLTFSIEPPQYVVRSHASAAKIMVITNKEDTHIPITANYYITLVATKKNTPNEILFQKEKLVPAVLAALNKCVGKEKLFVYKEARNAHLAYPNLREFFFFPRLAPKQLLNPQNRTQLCSQLSAHDFLIKGF